MSGIAGASGLASLLVRFRVPKIQLLCLTGQSPDFLGMPPSTPDSPAHRHLIRGADLFHDALDKEVEPLQLAVGWEPTISLQQTIEDILAYWRQKPDGMLVV
jgi:hypothetical protein